MVKRKIIEFASDDRCLGRPVDATVVALSVGRRANCISRRSGSLSVWSAVIWFCISPPRQQQQHTAGLSGRPDRPRAIFFNSCAPFAPHLTTNDINFADDDAVTARASDRRSAEGPDWRSWWRRPAGLSVTAWWCIGSSPWFDHTASRYHAVQSAAVWFHSTESQTNQTRMQLTRNLAIQSL